MVLAVLLAVVAVLIQPLALFAIRSLWPTRDHPYSLHQQEQLRSRYGRTHDRVSDVVTLTALVCAVGAPFAAYFTLRWVALCFSQVGPGALLHFSLPYLAVPWLVAGYLLGVGAGPALIRARFRGEQRQALLYLYSLGEAEEGQMGRTLVRKASRVALAGILVPLLVWGNDYTIVGPRGLELPRPGALWGRETLPKERFVLLATTQSEGGALSVCLVADDGRVLDNLRGGDGRLEGVGGATRVAVRLIEQWPLPRLSVPGDGAALCALARQELARRLRPGQR